MRHQVAGRKLKRTHSHRKALLNNLASQLFEHKKVHTTEAKAKELKSFAERLISKAKNALLREKQGVLPDGQKIDIHNRRQVGRNIRNKAVLQELFDAIAPAVESRNGGYTRVVKTGVRRGDNARTALIELVDFAAPQDGATSTKRKKKSTKKIESNTNKAKKDSNKVADANDNSASKVVDKVVDKVEDKVEEVIDKTKDIAENVSDKVEEVIDKIEDKVEDIVENAKDKVEDIVDNLKENIAEIKDDIIDNEDKEENKA